MCSILNCTIRFILSLHYGGAVNMDQYIYDCSSTEMLLADIASLKAQADHLLRLDAVAFYPAL